MGAMKAWREDLRTVAEQLEAEGHDQAEPLRDLYYALAGPAPLKTRRRPTLRPRWRR